MEAEMGTSNYSDEFKRDAVVALLLNRVILNLCGGAGACEP